MTVIRLNSGLTHGQLLLQIYKNLQIGEAKFLMPNSAQMHPIQGDLEIKKLMNVQNQFNAFLVNPGGK